MDKMAYLLFREEAHEAEARHWSLLEQKFPRIAEHLVEVWNTPACDKYLQELLINDRGDRHGFPPEVVDDLFLLDSLRWNHDADGTPHSDPHAADYHFSSLPEHGHDPAKPAAPQSWIKRTFGA